MNRARAKLILTISLAAIAIVLLMPLHEPGLALAKRVLRAKFNDVQQITPRELSAWIADTNRPAPILLDVRESPEFAVSRIANTRRINPQDTASDLLSALPADRSIVLYCAVGYRSNKMARRLQAAGITNVFNLEGSIFAWASDGNPIENDAGATNRVHPFNWMGKKLLAPEHQADVPSLRH